MKTKIIPFDLETAKKIQTGDIAGKIICNSSEAEILDFDLYFNGHTYVCAKTKGNSGEYTTRLFDIYGKDAESSVYHNLFLEVPDNEPQFKPFDKVLVRKNGFDKWKANFFSHMDEGYYKCVNSRYKECVLFEGNEHLVGTTDKPKEK